MIAGFNSSQAADNGLVRTKSLYPMAETISASRTMSQPRAS